MGTNKCFYIVLVIFLIGIQSCGTKKAAKSPANNPAYHPGRSMIHPKYTIYHNNELTSTVIGKLYPSEFMFSMTNSDLVIKAQIKIRYEIREIIDGELSPSCSDSAEYTYEILKENSDKSFYVNVPVKASFGKQYQLTIYTSDELRDITISEPIFMDKLHKNTPQNFQIIKTIQHIPVFPPNVVGNAIFSVEYPWKTDSMFISYYSYTGNIPNPPSSPITNIYEFSAPDSVWGYPFNKKSTFNLADRGIYFLQTDTSLDSGCTVLNFNDDFPRISTPESLLEPLTYITSDVEYDNLKNTNNLKLTIDNFWLEKTNNIERSKELIRIYYNRVYFANYYFTTYKEGWKTDMGMIYVVYGPPNNVIKSLNEEQWQYLKRESKIPVNFTFKRVDSPFSDQHYMLNRSDEDNTYWRQAVDSWRTGQLFILE